MRGSYRPTCGASDANVSERGGDDRLAICIGLLFVVSLQLRGHMVVLIILGIVGHTGSKTHRTILLNCGARTIYSWSVPTWHAAATGAWYARAENVPCNEGAFGVRLRIDLTHCYQLLHCD